VKDGLFTEGYLVRVVEEHSYEEFQIKREIAELELLADSRINDLEGIVKQYLSDIRDGLERLDKATGTKEEADEKFQERKEIVRALIANVILRKNREPEIPSRLDLSPLQQYQYQESSFQRIDLSVSEMKIILQYKVLFVEKTCITEDFGYGREEN
jgi:hypothetical protein